VNLHSVRRIAGVLVSSQIRSGRSTSDPNSLFGRPMIFGAVDLGLFALLFALTAAVVPPSFATTPVLRSLLVTALPFLPLYATAAVLVAGVMFELTATAKFSGSDAVNWLPVTPREYVLASSSAIAYTYSPALAFVLGPLAALALDLGLGGTVVLAAFLGVVGLFVGAFLVEMVRSATQRAGAAGGRRGRLSLIIRAVALLALVLALQLAFNPVFLLDSLGGLTALGAISAFIPVFWSTHALTLWIGGDPVPALGFVAAQLLFAAALLWLAAELRVRYWVVSSTEFSFAAHAYASAHPFLDAVGLSRAEASIVTKDFHGLTRRREMLPMLVVPLVIFIVILVESAGPASGGLPATWALVIVGWAGGFLALLLSTTSVGQERRAFQTLYAAPVTGRSVFRAKAVAVLLPTLAVTVGTIVATALVFDLPWLATAGMVGVGCLASVAAAFWGLAFAARFSDFQERPRPQYLRPAAMLTATLSGMSILFAILIPGGVALATTGPLALPAGLCCLGIAGAVTAVGWHLSQSGFDRLFRELPF
jgi:predicted permease